MRDFRELIVWQRAHRLSLETYRATATFPDDERFGLTSQLRRSTSSIEYLGHEEHERLTAIVHRGQEAARRIPALPTPVGALT